jgi:hypothetical protein
MMVIDLLGQVVDRTTQPDRNEKIINVTIKKPLSELVPPCELRRLHER